MNAPAPEIRREFVALESPTARVNGAGFHPCQGIWYAPARGKPRIGVISAHYNVDFSEHYLAPLLAARGLGFLGWNTRFRNNETWFRLDHALVDIGVGVRWLREEQGVETIVLLGNCGGGSLMAAYQSQATEPNVVATRGARLPAALETLLPGDLYVSLQAHPGRPEVLAHWLDPSVTDELDPVARRSDLDMYAPEHGPPYTEGFVVKYRAAQRARSERITEWVVRELERLEEAGAADRNFNVHRTWADLRFLDASIDPSERPSGRCLAGDPGRANTGPFGIAATSSLLTWLSMWSLEHSQCRGAPHLARIRVPSLVIQSTADTGVFPSDARAIHEALGSEDKRLEWMPGDHYLGEAPGLRDQAADMVAAWVAERTG